MIPNDALNNNEAKKELNKIKEIEKNVDREKLIYKASGNTNDFRKFRKIKTFGRDIYDCKINLEEADKEESDLLNEIKNYSEKTKPKSYKKNMKKKLLTIIYINFMRVKKRFLMVLEAEYF